MKKRTRAEETKDEDSGSKSKKAHWTELRPMPNLELRCEWADCGFNTTNREEFLLHVEKHEPQEEFRKNDEQFQSWHCCLWENCGFDSEVHSVARFHINYHAFHTRIKALGTQLLNNQRGLDCHLDYEGRNLLPVLPNERACEWTNCLFTCDSYQRLIDHMQVHVKGRPRRQRHQMVSCEWRDCQKEYKNFTELKSHLKIHTQEKVIGCPVCGAQFANKTKLIDHCARQGSPETKRYKCSYCKKCFPSERIMRDHIRLHVNLHKCPYCEMTCPYRYTLTLHIRYRHVESRPFKCTFCDHWSTTERDLESHYQTHCSENFWACEQDGCDFSCRSKNGLTTHYKKAHADSMTKFACHICDALYNRGDSLTQHLKNLHSYRWASGHTRFWYTKGDKGFYTLQAVRYESAEVAEQIIEEKTKNNGTRVKKLEFNTSKEGNSILIKVASPQTSCRNQQEHNEIDTDEDADDVQPLSELIACDSSENNQNPQTGSRDSIDTAEKASSRNDDLLVLGSPEENADSEVDSDSEFGESLHKHLGLSGSSFIEVIKTAIN